MKIVELKAENVKRLTAVEITPDGTLVVVGGGNGEGKSSVLDSILYALGGAASLPGQPVRKGSETAEVAITIDSNPPMVVRRKMQEGGKTSLVITQTNPSGMEAKVSSPQKLLDTLCGKIAFDPLAFTRMRPQDQASLLRDVVGLDLADIDAEIAAAYDQRAEDTKECKQYESKLAMLPHNPDAPDTLWDMGELLSELAEIRKANEQRDAVALKANVSAEWHVECGLAREMARAQVVQLEQSLTEARDAEAESIVVLADVEKAAKESAMQLESMQVIDERDIQQRLASAESVNTDVRVNKEREEVQATAEAFRKKCDAATEAITELRNQRIKQMDAADWPVDGLGFSGDGVTFNDLPFDQCSSAEQLRISTAIGLSQNPKLRVLLIRDGSLLDENSLAAIGDLARENNAQVWIERVGNGAECSVIIEDGAVSETRSSAEVAEVSF